MFFSVSALSSNDCFMIANFVRNAELKPMVPKDGQVQIRDEAPVRRVGEDIIHAARLQDLVQGRRVVSQHLEILRAVQCGGVFGAELTEVSKLENLLLRRQDIQIPAAE